MKKAFFKFISIFIFTLIFLTSFSYAKKEKVSELLVELASSIKTEYMSKTWKNKYNIWKSSLSRNNLSLHSLKKSILEFDKHLTLRAYKREHQRTVHDWHLYLVGANSMKSIFKILLKINSLLDKHSRNMSWKDNEEKWLKAIKSNL